MFDKTGEWLKAPDDNHLIVVLDEAHFYQGSQGSEVALLLRRLLSRLRVARDRVRFILTSASLGGSDVQIRDFAAELTGGEPSNFSIVRGVQDRPQDGRPASPAEAAAFAAFEQSVLHGIPFNTGRRPIRSISWLPGLGTLRGSMDSPWQHCKLRPSCYWNRHR